MMSPEIFKNPQLDIQNLPRMEEIAFTGLQRRYRNLLLINRAIFFFLLILTGLILAMLNPDQRVLFFSLTLGLALLGLISLFFVIKSFPYYGYALRQRDIVYKKGWLSKRWTTVPFNRVQHVDIKQGVLERAASLCTLNVYSAGGQSSDLTIPGLTQETAGRLKSFIIKTVGLDEEE